jgi:excisionase family DNA binding protein
MMTPGMAASLLGVRLRGIYRLIEAGQLHFLETPAGLVLVCRNSLSQSNQLPAAEPGSPNKLNKES